MAHATRIQAKPHSKPKVFDDKRVCDCGTILNSYHRGSKCYACQPRKVGNDGRRKA